MLEVRRLRQSRGWNQTELAYHAGLASSVISQIETGKRSPSASTLSKLAAALEVQVGDLFPKGQAPLPLEQDQAQRGAPFVGAWADYMLRRAREWERALEEEGAELFGEPEFVFDALDRNALVQTEASMLLQAVHEALLADEDVDAILDEKATGYPPEYSEGRRRVRRAVDEALLAVSAVHRAGMGESYVALVLAADRWDERAMAAWEAAGEEVERRKLARAWERSREATIRRRKVAELFPESGAA